MNPLIPLSYRWNSTSWYCTKMALTLNNPIFFSASHLIGLYTRSMTRRSIIVGIRGREGRTLLDYAGHRPTKCNMGMMSLAGHGPRFGSRYVYLIIAETGPRVPGPYKDDKRVNDAARPPEGRPPETDSLSASGLPWSIDRPARMPDSPLSSQWKYWH